METTGYTTLTRQAGLLREMQIVANNIANTATSGYRQEGGIFSEYVSAVEGAPSLSMGQANVRRTSFEQGTLDQTGGTFDLAIEGEGFFLMSFAVEDMEATAADLKNKGLSFTSDGDRKGLMNWQVRDLEKACTFGAQIQLCEERD